VPFVIVAADFLDFDSTRPGHGDHSRYRFYQHVLMGGLTTVVCLSGRRRHRVLPIGWQFLKTYQRSRILTFLDPDRDPLGAGYHVIQRRSLWDRSYSARAGCTVQQTA
jgi:hypothetical protein